MTVKRRKELKTTIDGYEKDYVIALLCGGLIWLFLFSVKLYTVQPSLGIFWYVWVLLIVSLVICVVYYREDKKFVSTQL